MKDFFVVLNPWAGRGTAGRYRLQLEQQLREADASFDMVVTEAQGGATRLAWEAVERGYRTVVAVGGDGTINEVVNGLLFAEQNTGLRTPLGIVPLGTGSDFVKSLDGVKANDIVGAVKRLLAGEKRPVDVGRATIGDQEPRLFLNALEVGFDAQIAAEALKIKRLRGLAVYLVAIARALTKYRAQPMKVNYDDQQIERPLLFASIGNGQWQGGGFNITPDAEIDDGQLDLCAINKLRLDQIVRYIPKVMKGTHTNLDIVTMARSPEILIEAEGPIPVAADGEVLTTEARQLRVETLKHALDVVV
jgi:YegS/Rv2252/BmrU family lipid kinase